jgi:hypothetical protein
MAKAICNTLDRIEGKKSKKCDSGCKNHMFPHLDNACVLSDVYSVRKNEPCYIYEIKTLAPK